MKFQTKIEQQMRAAPKDSVEKESLKFLMSEIQKESYKPANAKNEFTDEQCHKVAKRLLKDNEETLVYLRQSGSVTDREKLEQQNAIFVSLLPVENYWSKQDIRNWLKDEKIDVLTFSSTGQAVGKCMSKLKGMSVRGEDVKDVIEELVAV